MVALLLKEEPLPPAQPLVAVEPPRIGDCAWTPIGCQRCQQPPSIRVRAPATSANLGPAFDAAGIALDWWDELEVRPAPVDAIQVSGEQAELLPTGRDNLVAVAMRRLAEAAGAPCRRCT